MYVHLLVNDHRRLDEYICGVAFRREPNTCMRYYTRLFMWGDRMACAHSPTMGVEHPYICRVLRGLLTTENVSLGGWVGVTEE